jgi:hypothetical protein
MIDNTSTGGNSYANPGESFGPIGNPAQPKKKRGGRKPGSKNKPKVKKDASGPPCKAPHVDIQFQPNEIEAAARKVDLLVCIELLTAITNPHVSAMASESRLTEIIRQQSAVSGQVAEKLRAML